MYVGYSSNGNVYGEYSVTFSGGEELQKCWPDARLTLHEAINKIMKEKEDKSHHRRRRSSSVKVQFDSSSKPSKSESSYKDC